MEPCPVGLCDGSGMRDVYVLRTVKRFASGGCAIDKIRITREQAADLRTKIDWKDQTIAEASEMCDCRAKSGSTKNPRQAALFKK